jgi:hypothetical protein
MRGDRDVAHVALRRTWYETILPRPYDAIVTIRFGNCARALSTHPPLFLRGASITRCKLGPSRRTLAAALPLSELKTQTTWRRILEVLRRGQRAAPMFDQPMTPALMQARYRARRAREERNRESEEALLALRRSLGKVAFSWLANRDRKSWPTRWRNWMARRCPMRRWRRRPDGWRGSPRPTVATSDFGGISLGNVRKRA